MAVEFTGAPTSGVAPLVVSFTDQTTGNVASWSWDFGDGGSSDLQHPTHTYDKPGVYDVEMTITRPNGTVRTSRRRNYIHANGGGGGSGDQESGRLDAEFTANKVSGVAPTKVRFTDLSTGGNIDSWDWDFGDGSTGNRQNPQHRYIASGVYTVSLTVGASDTGDRDTETKVDYLTITSTPPQDFPEFIKRIFDRFTGNTARDVDNLGVVTLLEMSKGINYDLSELGQVEQALGFIAIGASGSIGEFAVDVRRAWVDYQSDLGGSGAGTQDYLILWTNMMRRLNADIETQNETYIEHFFTCIREYIGFSGNEVAQVDNAVTYMNRYRRFLLDLEAALLQYQSDLGGGT